MRQVQDDQTGAPEAEPDEFCHVYGETLEHKWPGQIIVIGAAPRRIEMNDRESLIRIDGGGQRRGPIAQTVFDEGGQTGERHVVHRDVDRGAIVVDRLNVAARFRVGICHLTNAGEYVEHAPVYSTATVKTR